MSAREMVVVSHRGWDGSRIIGIFDSLEDARESTKDFIYDTQREELIFDVMEVGKLSQSACHVQTGNNMGIIIRQHRYSFPPDPHI